MLPSCHSEGLCLLTGMPIDGDSMAVGIGASLLFIALLFAVCHACYVPFGPLCAGCGCGMGNADRGEFSAISEGESSRGAVSSVLLLCAGLMLPALLGWRLLRASIRRNARLATAAAAALGPPLPTDPAQWRGRAACLQPSLGSASWCKPVAISPAPTTPFTVAIVATCSFRARASNLVEALRTTGSYDGDVTIVYDGLVLEMRKALRAPTRADRVVSVDSLFPQNTTLPPILCYGKSFGNDLIKKRQVAWRAYYLKISLFSCFWRQHWERVLYVDTGCAIHRPLKGFFGSYMHRESQTSLLANPDAWPHRPDEEKLIKSHENDAHSLKSQFRAVCGPKEYAELTKLADLSSVHFQVYASLPLMQSTLMLYDTSMIRDIDMQEIAALFHKFGRIADGDQSILSLYFHNIRKVYRPLPYRLLETNEILFDFSTRIRSARAGVDGASYVVTAWRYGASSRPAAACEPLWNKTVWRPQAKCEEMMRVRKGNKR